MRVLTIYAHHNPHSFCHALLERFSAGLHESGHTNTIVDLHAIGFNPVLTSADTPNWIDDSVPDDVLENMNVRSSLAVAAGNPLRRILARLWVRGLTPREIIRKIHSTGGPADIKAQQELVLQADALVFISPVYFVGFPAILKGWIERVFSLGFAFGFTPEAWRGDIRGRMALLTQKKALILNTTIFDEKSYRDNGLDKAMKTLVDDYCLNFPGIGSVEHVYFHAVHGANLQTRQTYLDRAYELGKNFEDSTAKSTAP